MGILFADNKVQQQIERLMKNQDISSKNHAKAYNHSSSPQGLQKMSTWKYKGAEVTHFTLQQSNDVTVTVYVCEVYRVYWYRIQGSILGIDLWYGNYSYGNRYNSSNRAYFLEQFSTSHRLQRPTLKPKGLKLSIEYKTTDYGNIVKKYSHGAIYPGYEVFSYYCNRGNRYWVELVDTRNNISDWYGPYPFSYPDPSEQLKVVVSLDRSQYNENESPNVTITVHNNSSRGIWLKFSSGQRGDYTIDNRFRWSQNMMFTQVLGREFVAPYGKVQIFQKQHPSNAYRLSPGTHSLVGIVTTTNYGEVRSDTVTFTVRRQVYNPPPQSTKLWMDKAIAFMKQGKYRPARKLLLKIIAVEPNNQIAYYNLACTESVTYNEDLALDYLSRAMELGYRDFSHMRRDPDLNNIRHLYRYKQLMRKYRKY